MAATKTAKPKAPNKTEKSAAYNLGRLAFDESKTIHEAPHEEGSILFQEWQRGYTEARDTSEEQKPVNGHAFKDPDVLLSAVKLADLMLALDNLGVAIDETQWRALSEADQNLAVAWANDRRVGVLRPCPTELLTYANETLRGEIAIYQNEQHAHARVAMPCTFGKPSPTKPEGDEAQEQIKMVLSVPVADLSAGTANALWGWKRCHIEFGLFGSNRWNQSELPGVEQIVECVADVSGFQRNRTHWKFSFLVPKDRLSIVDAFDRYWKSDGSVRVEALSEPPKRERDDSENPESDDADDEPEEVTNPSLFDKL